MAPHADNGAAAGGATGVKIRQHLDQNGHVNKPSGSPLAQLLYHAFVYLLGISNYLYFIFLAVKAGTFFRKPTEKDDNDHAIARDAFWNLSKQPVPGFHHDVFEVRDGFQLHYICNALEVTAGRDLFILIHGFPNTSMTWRHMLQEPALPTSRAVFVAVDLPGCGGSDSMAKYDTQVLEYLTEFVIAMREKHGASGDSVGSTFIVGHDWGAVISMRLATDAPCLADRFIISNGPLPELMKFNIERALRSSWRIFKQFRTSPRANFGCLIKSYQAIHPLLRQIGDSGYIFTFQLPSPLVKKLGEGGNLSFLKGCHEYEHSAFPEDYKTHESMAANLGPSPAECETETRTGAKYGSSVARRVRSVGDMFWQTTAYYRDGLAFDPWEKSIETIAALYAIDSDLSSSESPSRRRSSSASSTLFGDQIKNGLRAPATMLWGEDDIALTRTICLDGLVDFMAKESEIILLPRTGHWPQVDRASRTLWAQIIDIFASGDSRRVPTYIIDQVKKIDGSASQLAKR